MATYAIGDVQGCFAALMALLDHIHFDATVDRLWFTGDLVNRGPFSLDVLRFIKALGDEHVAVLGNHDLHLLAVAYGIQPLQRGDTLDDILNAPDRQALLDWLRHRPLLHYDKQLNYVMTHAGLAPCWTLKKARALAAEVEAVLRAPSPLFLLQHLYGNEPNEWDDALTGADRWRVIINYLTRMRFCDAHGRLNLTYNGEIAGKPPELLPWFDVSDRANANENIIFGHWAALGGKTTVSHLYALDTGCVWGNCLTAFRLEDGERFTVRC